MKKSTTARKSAQSTNTQEAEVGRIPKVDGKSPSAKEPTKQAFIQTSPPHPNDLRQASDRHLIYLALGITLDEYEDDPNYYALFGIVDRLDILYGRALDAGDVELGGELDALQKALRVICEMHRRDVCAKKAAVQS